MLTLTPSPTARWASGEEHVLRRVLRCWTVVGAMQVDPLGAPSQREICLFYEWEMAFRGKDDNDARAVVG